ncbi:MAG: sugar phosphate isomerase/epimerase family protein [Clostridia bacterium]|nr:sugar phosphate isomerase/epimerase family protein [Clostridia bacterium]
MYDFPIGVMVDSFNKDFKTSVKLATDIGAKGIQMYCTYGEHAPENMTKEKTKEILDIVKSSGLVFSAICGDLGMGFGDAEKNKYNIEKSKRIMEFAKELECNIVTTHIGVVPGDNNHERYKIMHEACSVLAAFADDIGSRFAIETGPETADTLKAFLDSLGSKGVSVNLDPANFVMVTGDDPVKAVYTLKDYIAHTHAKDGIKLKESNPEFIYQVTHPIPEEYKSERFFEEVPLGKGSVDFKNYLKALDEIGYKGFLTIERECGDNPAADIEAAALYLKEIIKNN